MNCLLKRNFDVVIYVVVEMYCMLGNIVIENFNKLQIIIIQEYKLNVHYLTVDSFA